MVIKCACDMSIKKELTGKASCINSPMGQAPGQSRYSAKKSTDIQTGVAGALVLRQLF